MQDLQDFSAEKMYNLDHHFAFKFIKGFIFVRTLFMQELYVGAQ